MIFNLQSRSHACPFEITFQYHKPESQKLVVYNIGKRTVRSAEISLKNNKNEIFAYSLKDISIKTGCLISYSTEKDLNDKLFSGTLTAAQINCGSDKFAFKPTESGKFEKA